MSFNPFGKKRISDLEASDLAVLKDVAEGWYVEYKSQSISVKDAAKQLSAFSNQFGGFLFFGIKESQNSKRTAEEFSGVEISEIEKISTLLREATSEHLSPPVVYEEKVITGPCADIGLDEGKAILAVDIFPSLIPPHIHSCGKIYMRQADQSKPKALTDRYLLDELVKRQNKSRTNLAEFLNNTPALPRSQKGCPFLYVHILPDPFTPSTPHLLTFEQFCSCMTNNTPEFGDNMPMQTMYPTKNGFIAKQTANNDPHFATASIRFWQNRIARFEIPISYGTPTELFKPIDGRTYKYAADFSKEYHHQQFTNTKVCDFSHVTVSLRSLCNMYLHLMETLEETSSFYCTFEIRNMFYKIPFIDTNKYIDHCKNFGIPLIQEKTIKLSQEPFYDNMLKISSELPDFDVERGMAHKCLSEPISMFIRRSLGMLSDTKDYDWTADACLHMANHFDSE